MRVPPRPSILAVVLVSLAIASWRSSAQTPEAPRTFDAFLMEIRAEALTRGIAAATLDATLTGLAAESIVVTRDRTQPEQVQSLDSYLGQRLSRQTIATARAMAARHAALLSRVESNYGVPRALMVSIWGLESNFGRFTGTYPTIRALATLAYDNRRALFRAELFAALTMVDRGLVSVEQMKGSWAGAMGQPQFMPSSFLAHAVDLDADGHIDIWTSVEDVFGSMANYLRNQGWQRGERWGREVSLTRAALSTVDREVSMRTAGCRAVRAMTEPQPLETWRSLGVTLLNGTPLPSAPMEASLVRGARRHFLVYRNYEAILDYNCSHSYAIAASLLSDQVAAAP